MKEGFIETERLILREMDMSDLGGMFELDSDPEVLKFIGIPAFTRVEQSEAMINELLLQYKENGIGRWAVVDKATGDFLGWSGLKFYKESINNHQNFYELGYRFMKKYWGKGYATETAKAWLQYGFEELNADAIYAMTELEHFASKNVLEKVGFTNVEVFDYDGEDLDWLRITKEEWDNFLKRERLGGGVSYSF